VRLSWVFPATNGGSPITEYIVQRSPNGTSSWESENNVVQIRLNHTVSGLTGGTRYYFRVLARNAVGIGEPSNVTNAIPPTRPSAPRTLSAAATTVSGQVRLSWLAPTSNGGAAITDYIIQRSPNGTSSWVTINDGVRTTPTYTVTGLTGGTRYYFRVQARNAAGTGAASNIVNTIPRR
jgi:predicted phage tail protein